MVGPGMKLEMSIVMRQRVADQKKCPRCSHINSRVPTNSDWIEWQVSPNSMRIDN